jgi:hypothetical protein
MMICQKRRKVDHSVQNLATLLISGSEDFIVIEILSELNKKSEDYF